MSDTIQARRREHVARLAGWLLLRASDERLRLRTASRIARAVADRRLSLSEAENVVTTAKTLVASGQSMVGIDDLAEKIFDSFLIKKYQAAPKGGTP